MKVRDLECALSEVKCFQNPIAELEQYPTSAHLAAQVVHTMDSSFDDISGKAVCDLGCGTGMLSIATALLGAHYVLGVDVDQSALSTAIENASDMDVEDVVEYCNADIASSTFGSEGASKRSFDTVVMNPPFGTKRKGIDIAFLQKAFQISRGAVYSMHKSTTREHIFKRVKAWGANAQVVAVLRFDIGRTYQFHKSNSVDVAVDFWRFDISSIPDSVTFTEPCLPPPGEIRRNLGSNRANRGGPNPHRRRYRGQRKQNR